MWHRYTADHRHIAVTGDPADVGGAPVNVVFMTIENHLVGIGGEKQGIHRGVP